MEQNKLYKMMVGGVWMIGEIENSEEGVLGHPITILNPEELIIMTGVNPHNGQVGSMIMIRDVSSNKSILAIASMMVEPTSEEHEAYERHQAQKRTGLTLVGKG